MNKQCQTPTDLDAHAIAADVKQAARAWADDCAYAGKQLVSPAPATLNATHTGLRLMVAQAEHNAAVLGLQPFSDAAQREHIAESIGALLDTLDALELGLGTRLRQAMYVHSHTVANLRVVGPL